VVKCPPHIGPTRLNGKEKTMPKGKGTYGSQVGRPKKKKPMKKPGKKKSGGKLTAAQKKLPKALQAAIKRKKK